MTLRAPHFSGKRPRKVQPPQPTVNFLALTAIVAAPFFQTDFPNPQIQPLQQLVQTSVPLTILEDAGEKPFSQTEWPNPKLDVKVQTPFQVGSSLTLIEDAGVKPFLQTEWITPPQIKIQEPIQGQKPLALEAVALQPNPVAFQNPVFPRPQQPFQLQKSLVLFEPCDVDIISFVSIVPTDVSVILSENIDNVNTISENIDERDLIFTGSMDVSTTVSENIDIITTICET